ncbi:MAG: aldo/keto reductase [Rhodospirillaceae bacterium]|jgi:diketogulonate reductase-like aldo/keto reductase|nr:aldo/keto reductase [Rhodospirillaceae bacterium]
MKPTGRLYRSPLLSRRSVLSGLAATGIASAIPTGIVQAAKPLHLRKLHSTGETIPAIGLGSFITLDVGSSLGQWRSRQQVVQAFLDEGGRMIDSSPMYGSSEKMIGRFLKRIANKQNLFATTKVWTPTKWRGIEQMKNSRRYWGVERFDLMQIHNLVDWETHMETLLAMKAKGQIRYIGVTTSHGRKHRTLEHVLKTQPIDFVQMTYNFLDSEVEQRLLPIAKERNLAVIINRPFQRGGLFDHFESKSLPSWASEIDCQNWAQFFLKFVISHPAVTCAIPATSRVDHLRENMNAGRGRLPDAKTRQRMIRYIESL